MFSRLCLATAAVITPIWLVLYWNILAISDQAATADSRTYRQSGPVSAHQQASSTRVVAIADLHGDLDQALAALTLAGLIDKRNNAWCGGQQTLVQTGDMLDRGPDSLGLVRFFEGLKAQAADAGGQVHTLLGNHCVMNLMGNYDYVSPEELRNLALAGGASRGASQQALQQKGLQAWHQHMQESDPVGAALRAREAAVIAGEGQCRTLFVHAGLLPAVLQEAAGAAGLGDAKAATPEQLLAALQQTVSGALKDCATPGSLRCNRRSSARQILTAADSLVWLRDYVQQPERLFCPGLQQVLTAFAVRRMVVGHNVMRNGQVNTRCDGALQLADVGMSRAYYGNLAVWTCDNDRPEALYRNEVVKLPLSTCCHLAGKEEQTQQ